MNWLLKLLEKIGHKAIFVDFYGNVLMERYFLFYYEEEKAQGWWYYLPNIFIHCFPTHETPDGQDPHYHPWSTITFILHGKYTEIINKSRTRTNKQYRFGHLDHTDNHRITTVEKDTWSVFMHGWRRHGWTFDLDTCATICAACIELREGVCPKQKSIVDFDNHLARVGTGWRVAKWFKVSDATLKKIERRKKALVKVGAEMPESREGQIDLLRRSTPRGVTVRTVNDK